MDHTLFTALRQCWTVLVCQKDIWLYGSFVYFRWSDALHWGELLIMMIHSLLW